MAASRPPPAGRLHGGREDPKPVVAAVTGYALGGPGPALCAGFRVAGENGQGKATSTGR
jgi:enoyl-CoA hydratase/carnithine racemase